MMILTITFHPVSTGFTDHIQLSNIILLYLPIHTGTITSLSPGG